MRAPLLDHTPPLQFVLKVTSRCNLNCSYCYVYNKGDSTWKDRPVFMSDEVLDAALARIRAWCRASRQPRVSILFHGGEPLRHREWQAHPRCACLLENTPNFGLR